MMERAADAARAHVVVGAERYRRPAHHAVPHSIGVRNRLAVGVHHSRTLIGLTVGQDVWGKSLITRILHLPAMDCKTE